MVPWLACAAALLLARDAAAWGFEERSVATLPDRVRAIEVLPRGDATTVVALGENMGWVLDGASGRVVRLVPVGGTDALVHDVDGDGLQELVVCGPDGVSAVRWEGGFDVLPVRLSDAPCDRIAALDGPRLALSGGEVGVYELVDGSLVGSGTTVLPPGGAARIATHGPYLAYAEDEGSEIVETGPAGRSRLASGGRVGGLAHGPRGWVWTLPERDAVVDVTHRVVPVAPRPGAIALAQLDDHPEPELVVVHPGDGLLGVIPGTGGTEHTRRVRPGVTDVATGDLDGDGCDEIVVAWERDQRVEVIGSTECGAPVAIPVRPGSDRAVRVDGSGASDRDRTDDVSIPVRPGSDRAVRVEDPDEGAPVAIPVRPGSDRAVRVDDDRGDSVSVPVRPGSDRAVRVDERDLAPPPPPEPPPEPLPTVFGLELPPFLGNGALTDEERRRRQRYLLLGTGWAMGGTLRNTWLQIPFFPALSMEAEWGGPRARWFVGGDSAGLFFWITDRGEDDDGNALSGGGIHLANLSAGATFGNPRLRAGPFVTAGLFNAGAGIRTVFAPWEESRLEFRGIEARLTWFAPSTGQVSVMYVWSEPLRRLSSRDPRPDPVGRRDGAPSGPLTCSQFGAVAGAAVGGSSTDGSWEYVGSDVPMALSWSPMVGLTCDTGDKVGLLLAAETAPLHWFITDGDEKLFHMGSHTAGLMFGGERLRVGPIGTAGIWILGAGGRAMVRLLEDRQGLSHRLELRALALARGAPSGQVGLMYGLTYDPRR